MQKIYVTSDLHFGHKNIIKFENRPYKDVEEMTEGLINNWNSVVTANDLVYILGDFSFMGKRKTEEVLKRLRGKKILIKGNHDYYVKGDFDRSLFEEIVDYKEIKYNGKEIIMFHYPIAEWNGKLHGSIHLFGHIHSNTHEENCEVKPNSFNVGVDMNGRKPVALDYILDLMQKLEKPEEYIPNNISCCKDEQGNTCPFWSQRDKLLESKDYGYCHYLRKGDYELNKEATDKSTLWDKCKKCKINV